MFLFIYLEGLLSFGPGNNSDYFACGRLGRGTIWILFQFCMCGLERWDSCLRLLAIEIPAKLPSDNHFNLENSESHFSILILENSDFIYV